MATDFSSLLSRLRKEAGFGSPHEFWAKSGGARVLKLSYVNYWKIEQGKLLPKPERLSLLIACLRLMPEAREVQPLVHAYLKEYFGSDTAYQWLTAVLSKPPENASGMGNQASRRLMRERVYHLNLEQHQAILHDFACYWMWMTLSEDKGIWKSADLAKMLKISEKQIIAGAKLLASRKLFEILPDGSIRCPLAGRHFVTLPVKASGEQNQRKILKYQNEMAKKNGLLKHRHYTVLRADERQLEHYYLHLNDAVRGAGAYSVSEKTDSSALFLVEGNIFRLLRY